MTGLELRIIALLLCGVLAFFGYQHYSDLVRRAQQGELRGDKIERTDAIMGLGQRADTEKTTTEARVAETRIIYQEAKRHEPELADRSTRPLPASLRRLACERRLARERSARVAGGDAPAVAAACDGERKDVLR
jgi:hypothetical protein